MAEVHTETDAVFSAKGVASLGYELALQLGRLIRLKLHVLLIKMSIGKIKICN